MKHLEQSRNQKWAETQIQSFRISTACKKYPQTNSNCSGIWIVDSECHMHYGNVYNDMTKQNLM